MGGLKEILIKAGVDKACEKAGIYFNEIRDEFSIESTVTLILYFNSFLFPQTIPFIPGDTSSMLKSSSIILMTKVVSEISSTRAIYFGL